MANSYDQSLEGLRHTEREDDEKYDEVVAAKKDDEVIAAKKDITFEDIMKQLDELSKAADSYLASTKKVKKLFEEYSDIIKP